jgi:CheY-like chemotaxis protein
MHDRVIAEWKQYLGNRSHQHFVVATRQIRPANGAGEQGVSNKQVPFELEAHAARAMARRVVNHNIEIAEAKGRSVVEPIDRRRLLHLEPEHLSLLHGMLVQWQIVFVQIDRHVERRLHLIHARNVVDVGVREKHVLGGQAAIANDVHELNGFVARIDDDGILRAVAAHHEAVLVEGRDGADFQNHPSTITPNLQLPRALRAYRSEAWRLTLRVDLGVGLWELESEMVICVVDDLIFSIKISTAAKARGADVYFERNPEMVLARILEKQPSLVIFDLNSAKLRPMEAIAAMKADPTLRLIRTLGYVSHVHTDVINAARAAGIDEVLARSAFVDRLGQILTRFPTRPATPEPAEPGPRS